MSKRLNKLTTISMLALGLSTNALVAPAFASELNKPYLQGPNITTSAEKITNSPTTNTIKGKVIYLQTSDILTISAPDLVCNDSGQVAKTDSVKIQRTDGTNVLLTLASCFRFTFNNYTHYFSTDFNNTFQLLNDSLVNKHEITVLTTPEAISPTDPLKIGIILSASYNTLPSQ